MKYKKQMNRIPAAVINHDAAVEPLLLITRAEYEFAGKIAEICEKAVEQEYFIILLTGPSASGKTTTSKMIAAELSRRGKKVNRISLDNFYKNHDCLPFWSDGSVNYESVESLDIEYFSRTVSLMKETGSARFPLFDFVSGDRREKTFDVTFDHETFLIFEGIHALNPLLSQPLGEHSLKIYVSVHSDYVNEENQVVLRANELRLMRRMIRDSFSRNASAENTFDFWKYVVRGEEIYIKPFKQRADIHINSVHVYEPLLYKQRLLSMLQPLVGHTEHKNMVDRLIGVAEYFGTLDRDLIPASSLIREFIGK